MCHFLAPVLVTLQIERDSEYRSSVCSLIPVVSRAMHQNNTVDVYERYFEESSADALAVGAPNMKSLAVFKDPHSVEAGGTCNRTAVAVRRPPPC